MDLLYAIKNDKVVASYESIEELEDELGVEGESDKYDCIANEKYVAKLCGHLILL